MDTIKEILALAWRIVAPAWCIVILVGTVYSIWLEGYLRKNKPNVYKKLSNLGILQFGLRLRRFGFACSLGLVVGNIGMLLEEKKYDKETLYHLRILKLFWLLLLLPIILVIANVLVYHCLPGLCR